MGKVHVLEKKLEANVTQAMKDSNEQRMLAEEAQARAAAAEQEISLLKQTIAQTEMKLKRRDDEVDVYALKEHALVQQLVETSSKVHILEKKLADARVTELERELQ